MTSDWTRIQQTASEYQNSWRSIEKTDYARITLADVASATVSGMSIAVPVFILALNALALSTRDVALSATVASTIAAAAWSYVAIWWLTIITDTITHSETYQGAEQEQQGHDIRTLRVEVHNPETGNLFLETLPVSEDDFLRFARGAEPRGLGVPDWAGSAGIFSQSEYGALMDYLSRAGLVAWRDARHHNQGRALTAAGRATLRRIAQK